MNRSTIVGSSNIIAIILGKRVGLVLALLIAAAPPLAAQTQTVAAQTQTVAAQTQIQAENDYLIVPWQRVGPIALGMTATELVRIMGDPRSTWIRGVDIYNWGDLSATLRKDGSYVTQICTFSPAYATAQGVHPGSTDVSVADLLGEPKYSRVFSAWWRFSYTNLYWPGLMVSVHLKGYDTDHKVWKVCVNHFAAIAE